MKDTVFCHVSMDDLAKLIRGADRLAIVGTTEECIDRIKTLESQGVDQLFFYTALPDKQRLFNQLAEEVLPAVS